MTEILICKTCAAMNAYENYSMPFIKAAYEYIGNSITVTAFAFALGVGLLFVAFNSVFPDKFDPWAIVKRLILIIVISSILTEGTLAGLVYEALLQWGMEVAHGLLVIGSNGAVVIPPNAQTEAAKLVGSAEAYLWHFIQFSWNVIDAPNIFDATMGDIGDYLMSIVFGLLIFVVYGLILLYFTYMVLRSLIYMQVALAFSSLIIASAAFPQTRSVFKSGLSLILNAALTVVGAGFAMGITTKVLEGSQRMVACFALDAGTEKCQTEIFQLSEMMGVNSDTMTQALQSYEVFALFTVLGFFCLFIHYLVVKFISMLTGTPDDSNALMGFTAATKGALMMGAGSAFSTAKHGAKGAAKLSGPMAQIAATGSLYALDGAKRAGGAVKNAYKDSRLAEKVKQFTKSE